jgi:hypothetical protein
MAQEKGQTIESTKILFLSMFWGGGGPFTIPNLLDVCDWVNRTVLSREELESAINFLLAASAIETEGNTFRISEKHGREFDSLRRKRRKDRFKTVELYFRQFAELGDPPRRLSITDSEYRIHNAEYRRIFEGKQDWVNVRHT